MFNGLLVLKQILAVALLTLPLAAAEIHIDHVTIAGTNLDAIRKAFTQATGVPTEYGGPHANHASEMAIISFPDGSYLELMGIQKQADPKAVDEHAWSVYLRNNSGPCAFAIRVPDVSAELNRLHAAGIPAGTIERSGRVRPDGTKLDWETATVGPGRRGSLFPFLIRDFTSRDARVNPSGKPTTTQYAGVSHVVIGVRDLDAAIALYRKAYGLAVPRTEHDAALDAEVAWFDGSPIALAANRAASSWLARRVAEYGEAPVAFVIGSGKGKIAWADERKLGWRLGID